MSVSCNRLKIISCLLLSGALLQPLYGVEAAAPLTAQGKNRAEIQMERQQYSQFPEATYLLKTLIKNADATRMPTGQAVSFDNLQPLPMFSEQIDQPWQYRLRKQVVFVLGELEFKQVRISKWFLTLYNEAGEQIKQLTGAGQPPAAFAWDGLDQSYRPVAIGRDYYPELLLQDSQGRQVRLPQPKISLDQFFWNEKKYIKIGCSLNELFQNNRLGWSLSGQAYLQEISFHLAQEEIILLTISGQGQDLALLGQRLEKMVNYLGQRNLRIKKINLEKIHAADQDVVYFLALKR